MNFSKYVEMQRNTTTLSLACALHTSLKKESGVNSPSAVAKDTQAVFFLSVPSKLASNSDNPVQKDRDEVIPNAYYSLVAITLLCFIATSRLTKSLPSGCGALSSRSLKHTYTPFLSLITIS